MANDTESPLTLIAAILRRHESNLQAAPLAERLAPAFDPQLLHCSQELPPPQASVVQCVSSWGLPEHVASEVATYLSGELSKYQAFVRTTRSEILGQLIKTTFADDPSIIPSLVESTCDAVYRSAIDKMLLNVQTQVESFSLHGVDIVSGDDTSSESASEDDAEDGDDDDVPDDVEGEEDNAPMRPGEEVPPLETKYLPIFEALHERGKVLTKPEKTYLVNMTGMTYRQITIWFQNRRRGELKESTNMAASYSKASSVHSDDTSNFSDQELEKKLGAHPPNTAFDIRSWRLQSALATKDDSRGSIPPLSPLKYNLPSTEDTSDTESDTDLSDDYDDNSVPPGSQAPSLTKSVTTMDSSITSCTSISMARGSAFQPQTRIGDALFTPKETVCPRPIRSLPSSRRVSPSTSPHQTQHQYPHSFSLQDTQPQPPQFPDTARPPSQCVSSNESGLTVNLDATVQLQTNTLRSRSSPISASLAPPNAFIAGPSSISPSPPSTLAGSPQRQPSPATSTSPRLHTKPLPRRTGCAPRPRPPPRSGPSAPTPTPITAPSSARPSVILPPSSNPSLGNTTLGVLLRPNPPGPVIPQEMEERLAAMAGRMGVGASSSSGSSSEQNISPNAPRGGAPGNRALPTRGALFSFGPTSLPRTSAPPGTRPVLEQATQGSTTVLPSS